MKKLLSRLFLFIVLLVALYPPAKTNNYMVRDLRIKRKRIVKPITLTESAESYKVKNPLLIPTDFTEILITH